MTSDEDSTTEPPRTSRAAAKAERRQNLIDATITSIAKYGLSGTTLARVTDIAGTSIGLANFHFETKERLFEAVLTHLADEQRDLWQNRNLDASLSSADRLMAIIDSRFHSRICDRKKLAIWFAFYGDAGARDIYRKVVGDLDDELLEATVAILKLMIDEGGYTGIDPMETALALEAMYDGMWLNMLLYPDEFKRLDCRRRALQFVSAILPRHFQPATDRD
ncbi:TetR family transcriptional regulator C-terminal domain-containing protein [Tabrizicola sp.]|uniref:TetR family transcriptional regulator C-terminal domain-containing protein n=1 Tax=Tabrizicola sp. TaxID=2005166 RepID=UPI003F343440